MKKTLMIIALLAIPVTASAFITFDPDSMGNLTIKNATVTEATTCNGDVTLGDASGDTITITGTPTFSTAISLSGGGTVADDQALIFGTDSDIQFSYDETTDNRLEITDGTNVLLAITDAGTTGTITTTGGVAIADDQLLSFGGVGNILWETADANANALHFYAPEGGATDVPVFVFGDASIATADLTFFNGVTVPTIAVISDDVGDYGSMEVEDDGDLIMTVGTAGSDFVVEDAAGNAMITIVDAGTTGNATVSGTLSVTGEVNGTILSDQMTLMTTSAVLGPLSGGAAPDAKLLINWLTTVASGGTTVDYSDSAGETVTFTAGSTFTAADQVNKGLGYILDLDGTDDYVTISDSAGMTFDDSGANAVSITVWAEVIDTEGQQTLVAKWDTGGTLREYSFYLDSAEKINFIVYDESADKSSLLTSGSAVTAGWRMLTVTYDGTGGANALAGGNALLYVDGLLVADADGGTDPANYVAMEDLAVAATIGAELNTSPTGANFMTGDMGMVWVTGDELTAADVWRLYMATRGLYNL